MANNESFTEITEAFLIEIMKEVRTSVDADIKTKVEVLKEMTRWVQVKNKVAPEGAEGSKIDEYRNALKAGNDGDGGRNSRRIGGRGGKQARAAIDKIEAYENAPKSPEKAGARHAGTPRQDAECLQNAGNGIVGAPSAINVFKRSDSDDSIVTAFDGRSKSGSFGGI